MTRLSGNSPSTSSVWSQRSRGLLENTEYRPGAVAAVAFRLASEGRNALRLEVIDRTLGGGERHVEPPRKDQLLSVTEKGFGKRSLVEDYRKIKRGGKGVITIKTGGRNGDVISVMKVTDEDELIVTSVNGMVIRMPVQGISLQGRATMGVRVMRLKEDDKVAAVARLVGGSEEERVVEAGRTLTSGTTPNGDADAADEGEDSNEASEKGEPDEE